MFIVLVFRVSPPFAIRLLSAEVCFRGVLGGFAVSTAAHVYPQRNSRRCTCPQNNDNANLLGAFGKNAIGGTDLCQTNQSQPRGEHQRPIVHTIGPSMSHSQKPVNGTAYATLPYLHHTS